VADKKAFLKEDTMNINYHTLPLTSYDSVLQARAAELFNLVANRIGRGRVRAEKGSYSILRKSRNGVAAKIIIYAGRRKGMPQDGVYVLAATFQQDETTDPTMAVGPWWGSRYRYFRLASDKSIAETATFIAACSDEYDRRAPYRFAN